MENKKVFIGNLDFEVTESEVKNLLSKYGTVVSIKMHQKKGFAFVEMTDAEEAAKAAKKLDGVKFKDREIRASLEMKAGKARSLSVKKYKERGAGLSREKSGGDSDSRSRSEKSRDSMRSKSAGSSYGKPKSDSRSNERSSGSEERSSGEFKKERPGLPRPERDRWATERPAESQRPARKEWSGEKPSGDDNREGYGRYGRSFEKSLEKADERAAKSANRPLKDYTKERSGAPRAPKREWTPEKPSYSGRPSRDGEKSGFKRAPRPESDHRSRGNLHQVKTDLQGRQRESGLRKNHLIQEDPHVTVKNRFSADLLNLNLITNPVKNLQAMTGPQEITPGKDQNLPDLRKKNGHQRDLHVNRKKQVTAGKRVPEKEELPGRETIQNRDQ